MHVNRGEIVLAFFPHATGTGAKKRPSLVIQADLYNRKLQNVIVVQITSILKHANDPASLLIEVSTPAGQASGLLRDSVVSCVNIATIHESLILQVIGSLSTAMMAKVDECVKAALGILP